MRYVTIYNFDELSEKAKENAIKNVRNDRENDQLPWADENAESIGKIAEAMNCTYLKIDSYNLGKFVLNGYYSEEIVELDGKRVWAYIWNNYIEPNLTGKYYSKGKVSRHSKIQMEFMCPFTGYCADMILWDAWEYFKNNPTNVLGFIMYVEDEITKFLDAEDDYFYSDDYIKNVIEAEDIEFTESGEIF